LSILLSERSKNIKPSPTLAVSARAAQLRAQGKDIISLSAGEPDFDTPEHIKNAAIEAINDGQTKYTAVDGTPKLKQAIINKFQRENNLDYENNQILTSCGAKHSLYNIFQATLDPGNEVIIPAPYWASYPDMVKLAGAIPVIVGTATNNNFKMGADDLEEAITTRTRIIILNSPSNPSGQNYNKNELTALSEVLLKHPDILIVTDDIYEHIFWGPEKFTNIINVCAELYDRTIVVNGVSKAYSMTGWRIGYAAGHEKIIKEMKKIQSQSTSNPNSIAQAAAIAALDGKQDFIRECVITFRKRHDFLINELQEIDDINVLASEGTFYSFPDMNKLIKKFGNILNDIELAEFFLDKAEVAMVPGSAFGMPGCMRISFATSMKNLRESIKRIKKVL
jgi:aspartate aminotransferase